MDPFLMAQTIGNKSDAGWVLRQGVVVSVQAYTVTVEIAGSGVDITGVRYLGGVPPLPGAAVWLLANGGDLIALGSVAAASRSIAPRVWRTSNLSVATSTDTAVTWQAADGNALTFWNSGSNPTRLTVQVPGRYMATASLRWAANGVGFRTGEIRLNGGTIIGRHSQAFTAAGSPTQFTLVSSPVSLVIGDYVELIAWQNSGGALDLDTTSVHSTSLALEYLGP